jgi:murein DD-endopeptidase MepM/ murein hydrolase activator NlpD
MIMRKIMPRRLNKYAVCITLFAVFITANSLSCAYAASSANIDKQISKHNSLYETIRQKISSTKRKIYESVKKENNVTQQIQAIGQKITVTKQKANAVSVHIKKVERNIVSLNQDIVDTNKRISKSEDYLKRRLVSIYKYGGVTEFNLLLSSQGANDALTNSYLLSKIAKQDQDVIADLRVSKNKLNITHRVLSGKKVELKNKNAELHEQHVQLKSAANERAALLEKIRREKAIYIAQEAEFEKAARQLRSTVRRLLAQKRALMRKRSPGKKAVVYYKGGRLAWPVRGPITSGFGLRVHPIFHTRTNHAGIDISAPGGTPIGAAEAGEVLYAGWMRGYGQVVIIDHGGNLATVYGHMSRIKCSEGQKVSRGTVIGLVGSTGVSTGNHCHFEVRINGVAVNPMRYL